MKTFLKKFPFCLLLLTFALLSSPSVNAQNHPEIVIGTSYKQLLSTPEQDGALDLITKEAFRRIDFSARLPYLPAERSIMAANTGLHDGELNRIAGMEKLYPNLVRVPESTMEFHFVAIVKDKNIRITDWESLRAYKIGFIKGWKIVEQHIEGFPLVTHLHSAQQLFRHLEVGKVDVIIYGKLIGVAAMKSLEIRNIIILEPPLATQKMYMYLNHKHKDLADELADSLRTMKKDGTYDAIFSKVLKPYKKYLANESDEN